MIRKGILTILITDLIFLIILYLIPKTTLFITLCLTVCFIIEVLIKGGNNNENIR